MITDMRASDFLRRTIPLALDQISPLATCGVLGKGCFLASQPRPSSCKADGGEHENIVFLRRRAYIEQQVTRDLRARTAEKGGG